MNEAQKYALFDKNKKNFGRAASGALRPCVGLSAPSPSRRSAASVVPLLSLSQNALGQELKKQNQFEILKNQCYLCAYVPKIRLNQFGILKNQAHLCAKIKNKLKKSREAARERDSSGAHEVRVPSAKRAGMSEANRA